MTHPDEELLLDLAFGTTDEDPITRDHVRGCEQCQAVLASMERAISAGHAAASTETTPIEPPREVWAGIADELGLSASPATTVVPPTLAPIPTPSSRRWTTAVVGFAAGIVVAGLGAVALHQLNESPGPRVVSEAQVAPFEGRGTTSGQATVLQRGRSRSVRLKVTGAPSSPHTFVEAWLLDPKTNAMLALGVVRDSTQTFPIPDDLDLREYTAVDVSLEPMDGDPAHSSDSLARGELQPTS
ncbi:MAG: anti-sigma factor [Nocardioides sp.]